MSHIGSEAFRGLSPVDVQKCYFEMELHLYAFMLIWPNDGAYG